MSFLDDMNPNERREHSERMGRIYLTIYVLLGLLFSFMAEHC